MSFLSFVWGFFFLPELKNRSLEEVEEVFASGMPGRKLGNYESGTNGVGVAVSKLEKLDSVPVSDSQSDVDHSVRS